MKQVLTPGGLIKPYVNKNCADQTAHLISANVLLPIQYHCLYASNVQNFKIIASLCSWTEDFVYLIASKSIH